MQQRLGEAYLAKAAASRSACAAASGGGGAPSTSSALVAVPVEGANDLLRRHRDRSAGGRSGMSSPAGPSARDGRCARGPCWRSRRQASRRRTRRPRRRRRDRGCRGATGSARRAWTSSRPPGSYRAEAEPGVVGSEHVEVLPTIARGTGSTPRPRRRREGRGPGCPRPGGTCCSARSDCSPRAESVLRCRSRSLLLCWSAAAKLVAVGRTPVRQMVPHPSVSGRPSVCGRHAPRQTLRWPQTLGSVVVEGVVEARPRSGVSGAASRRRPVWLWRMNDIRRDALTARVP